MHCNKKAPTHLSVSGRFLLVMSEKVCKILLRPPLRLGVPQAGGEFVMLTFICRFT